MRRGALFAQALAPLPDGVRPLDALTSLALRGLVHADSFAPLREWLSDAKERGVKRRAMARATAQQAGRWEAVRPLRAQTMEERLERAFDRRVLLCRETAGDIPWAQTLELLRVWEYTGRVRRGYFVRGLSGAQFIREGDHAAAMAALESPDGEPVWLNAADPDQPWGRILPHEPDAQFTCVPGTALCLRAGRVEAILERQGEQLRLTPGADAAGALCALARDFARRRIFPVLRRLCLRTYPPQAREALEGAGFHREMRDYVLFRDI